MIVDSNDMPVMRSHRVATPHKRHARLAAAKTLNGAMTLNGNAPAPESRRINLNIGGRHFETTVSTLMGRGNNFFTSIIQHEPPSAGDEIFIDRDGDAFGPLLNYLRTGMLLLPPCVSEAAVRCAHPE